MRGLISLYHLCLILTFLEFREISHYRNHLPTPNKKGSPSQKYERFWPAFETGMADILDGSIRALLRPLVRVTVTQDSTSYSRSWSPRPCPEFRGRARKPQDLRPRRSGPE